MPPRRNRGQDERWAGRDKFMPGDQALFMFQINGEHSDWGRRLTPEGVKIPIKLLRRHDAETWLAEAIVDGSQFHIKESELLLAE